MNIRGTMRKTVLCLAPLLIMSCSVFDTGDAPAGHETAETAPQEKVFEKKAVQDLETVVEKQSARIEQNAETINRQHDRIASLESQLLELKKKQAAPGQNRITRVKYKNPETLYAKARNFLLEENYPQAAGLFSTFLNDYPSHALADNAIYWLGECHYAQGSFQQAIFVFKGLTKKYPKSPKVPDALLKTGYAYLSIDDTNRAHHFLKEVIKKYPFSPSAEKAQKKLGQFK